MILKCILLAIPISLDCIGIGLTYGIKNTYITNLAKAIIFTIFFVVTFIAVSIGSFLIKIFSLKLATIIGAVLIIGMGIWMIYQSFMTKKEVKEKNKNRKIFKFIIKPLGLTIKIIKDPTNSDLDYSNYIDAKEAIYLGLAISIDAFCAGIGCGSMQISRCFFSLFIAIFHVLFLIIGSFLGRNISKHTKIPENIWSIISGILLIIIGFLKF